jgi:hypothetical protein
MDPAFAGRQVTCANCKTAFTAPAADSPSAGRRCQNCGAGVAPEAIVCVNCGTNLLTGRPVGRKARPSRDLSPLLGWVFMLLLVGGGVGGWKFLEWRKEREQQAADRQKAAEVAKVEQAKAAKVKAEQEAKAEAERKRAEEAKAESERRKAEAERQRLAREKAAAEEKAARMAVLRERYQSRSKFSLFDVLTGVAAREGGRLSVDPDVICELNRVQVDLGDLSLSDSAGLDACLNRFALVVRRCPVSGSESNQVDFVTTRPIWAYLAACQHLRAGRMQEAMKELEGVKSDDSKFGRHCLALQAILVDVVTRRPTFADLSRRIRLLLADSADNYQAAKAFYRSAKIPDNDVPGVRRLGESTRGVQLAIAAGRGEKALSELRSACSALDGFLQDVAAGNRNIADRFQQILDADLNAESAFLLDWFSGTFDAVRGIFAEIEKSDVMADQSRGDLYGYYHQDDVLARSTAQARGIRQALAETPDEVRARRRAIADQMRLSEGKTSLIRLDASSGEKLRQGLQVADQAFAYDRANPMARAAAGYFRMKQLTAGMLDALQSGTDGPRFSRLAREFEEARKLGFHRAAVEVGAAAATASALREGSNDVGFVTGLCVAGIEGKAFPLTVRIEPLRYTKVVYTQTDAATAGVVTPYAGYWGAWASSRQVTFDVPSEVIVFEDYGGKDVFMRIAAQETYKWLRNTFPKNMNDRAIHIAFQSIYNMKAGDSAGIAMAVAACSAISNRPVRADVAMTGSFRSDGSVHAVGGIYEKVCAAASTPGIEIVILPRENEEDVMLVPIDKLCRVVIISAADVKTYLQYALDPSFDREVLANLRKAQVLLLAGKRNEAEPLLLEVAADCPENYTARRLLELLAFWKKSGLASTMRRGSI